jgi:hypothetical protein
LSKQREPELNEQQGIHQRRITLQDGRYLIFYTFDEPPAASVDDASVDNESLPEPDAQPEAPEERRV